MTRHGLLASGANELRALVPLWLPCLCVVAAGGALTGPRFGGLAMAGFALGSVIVGAHAVGHEYTHRTLGALLAQPMERRWALLVKLAVLAALLVTLAAAAQTTAGAGGSVLSPGHISLLVVLCSLFVAPTLTMLGRSSIAGVVFTVALAGLIVGGAEIVAGVRFEARDVAADRFRGLFVWWATLGLCGVCAAASWRLFTRLEALDGRGGELTLPDWQGAAHDAAAAAPRRSPLWCLATKEVHIQQMVFVLAGLFVLAVGAISLLEAMDPRGRLAFVLPVATFYVLCVPLVAGSMASAEERQLGTSQWQLLLPVSASRQWLVKSGMALGLSLLLALALPLTAGWLLSVPLNWDWPGSRLDTLRVVLIVVILTATSLYVSSLCRSGIRALLVAMSVAAGAATVMIAIDSLSRWTLVGVWLEWMPYVRRFWPVTPGTLDRSREFIESSLAPLASGAVSVLVWWFASVNHRSGEVPAVLVRRQLGWIALVVTVAFGLTLLMHGYIEAAIRYDLLKLRS